MNKITLLYNLGDVIRKYGVEIPKKHGSFWALKLKSGIRFMHDDYSYAVTAIYPDGSRFYFGMNFGGFTGDHVSENHYVATIELINEEMKG